MIARVYPKCIRAENALKVESDRVKATYKRALNIFKNNKRLMKAKGSSCGNVCAIHKRTENYHEQLQRLYDFYSKCKKRLLPISKRLENAKKLWKKMNAKSIVTKAKYYAMRKKCMMM